MPELEVPGKLHDFFEGAGKGYDRIHDSELAHRWAAEDPTRSVAGFEAFRSSNSYDSWAKQAEAGIADAQKRAVSAATAARQFADLESKLRPTSSQETIADKFSRQTVSDLRDVAGLSKDTNLHDALAEAAKSRAARAAGKPGTLPDAVLDHIEGIRAAVQSRGMHLGELVSELQSAVHQEVAKQKAITGTSSSSLWEDRIDNQFNKLKDSLSAWYDELNNHAFPTEADIQYAANEISEWLQDILQTAPKLSYDWSFHDQPRFETPVLAGGLQLHVAMIGSEIAEQFAARVGEPSFVAAYRFTMERPPPATPVPTADGSLYAKLSEASGIIQWGKNGLNAIKAALASGLSSAAGEQLTDLVKDVANGIASWRSASETVVHDGPANVHEAAGALCFKLRQLDRALTSTGMDPKAASVIRASIDAVHKRVQSDARTMQMMAAPE